MGKARLSSEHQADVIIVGGGLAGLTLAALLGRAGVEVLCLDRDPPASQIQENFDGRTTAISYGSRKVLEAAGVWRAIEREGHGACFIQTIQILDGSGRGDREDRVALDFDSAEAGGRMFGWIVENRDFRRCLHRHVQGLKTVRHIAPAAAVHFEADEDGVHVTDSSGTVYRTRLLVGADGRQSAVRDWLGLGTRGWAYGQQAVVCTVAHEHPHRHIAIEHFRDQGPFAILPMTDDDAGRHRSSVVWTVEQGQDSPVRWPVDAFEAGLTARFPAWYGDVRLLGQRFAYPLGLIHAHRYIGARTALVAEAGHAIHPIAGQGLNLGLRDIAALSQLVIETRAAKGDVGSDDVLHAYQRARRFDNMAMAGATDLLNRLFSNDLGLVSLARKAGLRAVARMPAAKRFFMTQAMGSAGVLPALIRDAA